jgi:hypothetical protein
VKVHLNSVMPFGNGSILACAIATTTIVTTTAAPAAAAKAMMAAFDQPAFFMRLTEPYSIASGFSPRLRVNSNEPSRIRLILPFVFVPSRSVSFTLVPPPPNG